MVQIEDKQVFTEKEAYMRVKRLLNVVGDNDIEMNNIASFNQSSTNLLLDVFTSENLPDSNLLDSLTKDELTKISKDLSGKRDTWFNPKVDSLASQLSNTYDQLKKQEKKSKEERRIKYGPKIIETFSVATSKKLEFVLEDDYC
jgi:hypothetical protein